MPWVLRLIAVARGVLRAARWSALATLIAGGIVLAREWDPAEPLRSLVLVALSLGPGLVLLHLVTMLASLPARVRFMPGLASRTVLLGVGVSYLLRPWYWLAVALSVLAAMVLLPLALLTLLGLR